MDAPTHVPLDGFDHIVLQYANYSLVILESPVNKSFRPIYGFVRRNPQPELLAKILCAGNQGPFVLRSLPGIEWEPDGLWSASRSLAWVKKSHTSHPKDFLHLDSLTPPRELADIDEALLCDRDILVAEMTKEWEKAMALAQTSWLRKAQSINKSLGQKWRGKLDALMTRHKNEVLKHICYVGPKPLGKRLTGREK